MQNNVLFNDMTVDNVYRVMLDVSALVTRGSDFTRRVAAEHERRADEHAQRRSEEAALLPASIIAVGGVEQPIERLMVLQSAIAKAAHLATAVGRLRFRLPLNGLLGTRPR